jgi:hypothetical protein
MSIFGKHENPLIIHTIHGGDRLIAEIFPHENGGIVFFDIGWCFNDSSFPIHAVEGKIEQSKKGLPEWRVGGLLVRELLHDGGDDPYWREWEGWQQALKTSHGKETVNDREFVHRLARSNGALI